MIVNHLASNIPESYRNHVQYPLCKVPGSGIKMPKFVKDTEYGNIRRDQLDSVFYITPLSVTPSPS